MKKSILKKLKFYMLAFGIAMGFVFPVYARFFVEWKPGMLGYFVAGCIAAGITVGVVSFLFVKVILLKPLLQVSENALTLKNKTITDNLDITSNDSVGNIIKGINASRNNIKDFLHELSNTTSINHNLLTKISSAQLANGNSFNNIDNSIDTVTRASSSISDHSSQICYTMVESLDSVGEWETQQQDMVGLIEMLSASMESLAVNSEKINSILYMVEDIARRTNLVSVNATIEASTAGQYGKGFIVVANEIRELAQSVQRSANDISGYTKTISADITVAGSSVKQILELIAQNEECSKKLKINLDKIEHIAKSNYKADKKLVSAVNNLNSSFAAINEVICSLSENTSNLQHMLGEYKMVQ